MKLWPLRSELPPPPEGIMYDLDPDYWRTEVEWIKVCWRVRAGITEDMEC